MRIGRATRREGSLASRAAEPYLNPRAQFPRLSTIVNLDKDKIFLKRPAGRGARMVSSISVAVLCEKSDVAQLLSYSS